jgi:hypothetical protein
VHVCIALLFDTQEYLGNIKYPTQTSERAYSFFPWQIRMATRRIVIWIGSKLRVKDVNYLNV